MGGDLNLKKSWHVNLMSNQRKVYEARQTAIAERKKTEERRRELEEERAMKELQDISGQARTGLEWMYQGAAGESGGASSSMANEAYLLGKSRVDKLILKEKGEEIKSNAQLLGSSAASGPAINARTIASNMALDPLTLIEKQKAEMMEREIEKRIRQQQLKDEREKKHSRKDKHDNRERHRRSHRNYRDRRDESEDRYRSSRRDRRDESDEDRYRNRRRRDYDDDSSEEHYRAKRRRDDYNSDEDRRNKRSRRDYYDDSDEDRYRRRSKRKYDSDSGEDRYRRRSRRDFDDDDKDRSFRRRSRSPRASQTVRNDSDYDSRDRRRRSPSPRRSSKHSYNDDKRDERKARSPPPKKQYDDDRDAARAAKLAAMQANATALEEDRNKRLKEMEARDAREKAVEDEKREKDGGMFKAGLHKQTTNITLEGRSKGRGEAVDS